MLMVLWDGEAKSGAMGRALGNPQEQPSRATALPLRPHWPGTLLLDQSVAGAGLAVCPVPGLLLAAHKWNFFELTGVLLSATRAAHTGKITDRSGREGLHKPGAPHRIELHPGPGVTSPLLQPWLLGQCALCRGCCCPGLWPTGDSVASVCPPVVKTDSQSSGKRSRTCVVAAKA